MKMPKYLLALLATSTLSLAAGCGGKGNTVSGTVTFNGQPVSKGYVTFYPEDGKGTAATGEISDGRYTATNVPAGKHKVVLVTQPAKQAPDSMGDVKKSGGPTEATAQPKDEGNSKVVDVNPGSNELNLDVRTSSSSGPPLKK